MLQCTLLYSNFAGTGSPDRVSADLQFTVTVTVYGSKEFIPLRARDGVEPSPLRSFMLVTRPGAQPTLKTEFGNSHVRDLVFFRLVESDRNNNF